MLTIGGLEENPKPSSVSLKACLVSSPVGRMVIYLGPWLLRVSSDLTRPAFVPPDGWGKFEWALLIPPEAGSGAYWVLLRVGFTKLSRSLGILVSSCLTFSPLPRGIGVTAISQGGIFSVALSLPC